MVGIGQAATGIKEDREFAELKGAFDRVFGPGRIETFLRQVRKQGARIRDVEAILAGGVFDKVDDSLGERGAESLYRALTVSAQAQLRKLYLSRVEEIGPELRRKFQQLYRYY
jgi:hypothetical protein